MLKFLQRIEPWLAKRAVKVIQRPGEPIIWIRYYLFNSKWFSVFLHHFHSSDVKLHCHPWANVSIIVSGRVLEKHHDGTVTELKKFRPRFRTARELHQLLVDPTPSQYEPVWSIFIHFRRYREWGFADVEFEQALNRNTPDRLTKGFFPKGTIPGDDGDGRLAA